MATYTCWADVLDDVSNHFKKNKTFGRFSKLKHNEDRIEYCLRDDFIRGKVQQWLNIMCSSRHKKYWEKASELRSEGNLCFQEKKYARAVEFYTQSILAAPFPKSEEAGTHGEELSLGYGNRSAALFHMHKNEECLKDITRAIEYEYPVNLRFKLMQRRGQCLIKLNRPAKAIEALNESVQLLEDSHLDSKRIAKTKKELEILIKTAEEMEQPVEDDRDINQILPLSYGTHPSIDFASSAVDIKHSKQKGRHIVANREILAGDTLFVEEPYASVLLPGHYSTHCHHCYVKELAVVPCHQCAQVRYCSQNCVDQSWEKYHRWECGNLDSLHSVGIAHLSFRVILITGLRFLQEHREELVKTGNANYPFDFPDRKYRSDYFAVYHLVAHEDMPAEDTFQYALTALLLLMLLDRLNFFSGLEHQALRERLLLNCSNSAPVTPTHKASKSPVHSRLSVNSVDETELLQSSGPASLEVFVGGLLLRHILQLICNASAITELQVSPQQSGGSVLSQRQVKVATGIFAAASLMNHACNPTVISSFCRNVLMVRAVCDMPTGSEVFNCYGPHYRRMSLEDRQRSLMEQYFFICECDACLNGEELEQRFQALKCSHCSGPLRAPDTANKASCLDCDRTQDCASQLQKVFTAHDMFVQGLQLAAKGNFKDALERLKKCQKTREKVMYKYNRHLSEVQDQLACCYASLDKMLLAVDYLRPTLVTTEHIYGKNSIEYGNELQKFSDLLLNALHQASKDHLPTDQDFRILVDEARSVLDKSHNIFSLHYGPYHESLKEIREKQKQVELFLPQ